MILTSLLLADSATIQKSNDVKPDGTAMSGYVTPDLGPFKCANCVHFSDKKSMCDQPKVIADPKVRGRVKAEACCNYFRSLRNQ